ncbi:MAG: hypothetical protein HY226_06740 [Candidatus Vogelbacteria bacterium]|nr:hypothetical protein [Candidatus Vogelbacteria bacterium]
MTEKVKRGENIIKVGKELGRGREKIVYADPDNKKLAKGIFHEYKTESIEKVKGRFYLTKILHMLYPKNIPGIHLSASNPHMIIVDKVDDQIANIKEQLGTHVMEKNIAKDLTEELGELIDDISFNKRKIIDGLDHLGVIIDEFPPNFAIDEKNNIKFVDSIDPWHVDANYSSNKLKKAIENLEDAAQKKRALIYLAQLDKLEKSRKI